MHMLNNLQIKWEESLDYVYSSKFDAELNVVSGTNAYFRVLQNELVVQYLIKTAKNSDILQKNILERIYAMSQLKLDNEYANPNDTAMAVSLWILWNSNLNYAYVGAEYIKNTLNLWYASKLAACITYAEHNIINNRFKRITKCRCAQCGKFVW